ncbi:MAG: hypothetical protein ACTSRZ_05785 [Promethearchaeota archaeon]
MIPKINLENLNLSKMICGTNQFVGITHRNNPIDMWLHLRRFKDPKTIADFMIYLMNEHGVNCCLSSPRDKIYKAIQIVEKETNQKFHWICTPSTRKTAKNIQPDIFKQIDWCEEHNVSVCMPHRSYTDKALDKNTLKIGDDDSHSSNNQITHKFPPYPQIATYIRDKKMIPGLSTHYIETINAVEKYNYDAPIIIQPLNQIGFESNTSPQNLVKKIQSTKIQIIAIKPMAAGRLPPNSILWTLKQIKPNDFIAVGFGKFKFCMQDAKLIDDFLKK